MSTPNNIFSYRPYWAKRFGFSPFLPMSREEMEALHFDSCDVILVTGDAYVDHPSFGMALIGRLLEAQGFRVGIISQPNWHSTKDFQKLGKPNLFFGVTAGNMDSMVNHYTADQKIRSDDSFSPNGLPGRRPDRASIVYANRCREAYSEVPIILGGPEASLRYLAHYDYWSDTVRKSILFDAKADLLIYGNAERAITEIAHRLAKKEKISEIRDVRGTVFKSKKTELPNQNVLELASYEVVKQDKTAYAINARLYHLETNPYCARTLIQVQTDQAVVVNPPPFPLTMEELDALYELPYARKPHPVYEKTPIPAYEMIRFSVCIMRGCFGGCTFCSLTKNEGKIVQSRSLESIKREVETIRDTVPGFTGIISDLGGPTANLYRLGCRSKEQESKCRRFSCLAPTICKNLNTDHTELIKLYQEIRAIPGVKKVLIGSGVRHDLAVLSPRYVRELVSHHVGGYLKVAPEHISPNTLSCMLKPGVDVYERFLQYFKQFSVEAKKEQYLIPYFIAAHPGTTNEDMLALALWLKKHRYRLDQVQTFLPTPMTLASTMYHTEKNPLVAEVSDSHVVVPKGGRIRRIHKAFLRYHDPKNWPILRETLKKMGRSDLIGYGKQCLVPPMKTLSDQISMERPRQGRGRSHSKHKKP